MALSQTRDARPDRWPMPSQPLDPSLRRMTYGKIRPMDDGTGFAFWRRLFRLV